MPRLYLILNMPERNEEIASPNARFALASSGGGVSLPFGGLNKALYVVIGPPAGADTQDRKQENRKPCVGTQVRVT